MKGSTKLTLATIIFAAGCTVYFDPILALKIFLGIQLASIFLYCLWFISYLMDGDLEGFGQKIDKDDSLFLKIFFYSSIIYWTVRGLRNLGQLADKYLSD